MTTPPAESPESLAQRAAAGDGAALASLIAHVQDDVYRLARRMLWHPEDAEDATQEILFKIVTSVATFRGESQFRTWAFRVASNHLLNVRRSRAEEARLTFESFASDLADGLTDASASPRAADEADHALLEEEVKIGCTQAMLLCLDRDERIAYLLGDVFELRSEDGGEILSIAPAAFRKRLSRARARIRGFMEVHCGLVNESAACRCARRVAPAIARGRVDPSHLLFATERPAQVSAARRLPVLEVVGAMERLHEIAAIHQNHPRLSAPGNVVETIRRILASAEVRTIASWKPQA